MKISDAKKLRSVCVVRKFLPQNKREQYVIEQILLSSNLKSTSTIKNWYSGERTMLPSSVEKLEPQYPGIKEYYNEPIFKLLMPEPLTKNQILKIGWKQFHALFYRKSGEIKAIEFRPYYAVPDDSFNSITISCFTNVLIELRLGLAYRYEVPLEEIYQKCLSTFLTVSLHKDFYHSRSLMFSSLMEIMKRNRHELKKLNITKNILKDTDISANHQLLKTIDAENSKEILDRQFTSGLLKIAKMVIAKKEYEKSLSNNHN
ncbi:MAG: hypothetical protein HWE16_02540 [Gammaproteobacteria bacterium]|nr:hypothetical protein [Gammaproteobacteria bacterium]